ncbi:MAG: beta-ketoacyl-ACP reductase [Promethearchaeota archaeon Loki_b31]|nr:MAG: beta-ketoacyl-ACP reductase [Candidatus Lokiarchaeota archaeon Loki_b31]
MENKFLDGKVVLITGAGNGFGREMAITFASKGANLVLNDIIMKGLEETRDLVLKDSNVEILLAQADISKLEDVERMKKQVFDWFDNVFILINNAGIDGGAYKSLSASEETYDKVMGINAKGTWNVTKTFFRKMKSQRQFKPIRAKIINIASCAGTANGINPMLGIYSASKATVIAFTKLWALELGPVDITVNALSPGVFLTPIYDNDPRKIRQFLETRGVKIPIDKIGDSKWVADLALFLASPTADYITGQNIILDGGMTVSINKL